MSWASYKFSKFHSHSILKLGFELQRSHVFERRSKKKEKEKCTLLKCLIIWFLEGQEIGYIRIGLLAIRGTLEVEIIRGIILLIPGDHPPGKTTVQILSNVLLTFVVELDGRILKLFLVICLFLFSGMATVYYFSERVFTFFIDYRRKPETKLIPFCFFC